MPAWAALDAAQGERARLVVVERADRTAFEDGEIADWIRDARRLSSLDHPNVARVRDVVIQSRAVLVVSDFVDGVRWKELGPTTTLETALRVLVDALTGLGALHGLRDMSDPKRPVFKLVHGGLTPDCIIVGLDGIARVAGVSRLRSATARLAGTGSAYLAPEVLLEDDSADARADVYSIGVMLWEALSRRRFLPDLQPSAIVTQLLSGRLPPVTLPEGAPWAAPLADVVTRALSADPDKRFATAAAMATELRRIGALKLPLAVRVAAMVREGFGDAAKTRREMLERGEVRASEVTLRGRLVEELSVDVSDDIIEESASSRTASTVPPPGASPEPLPSIERLGPVNVVAAPLVPVGVPPPPAPVVLPPLVPVGVAPPPAPVAPPVPERAAIAPLPVPLDPSPPEITTAAPFAVATPALPAEPRPARPKGVVAIFAAGAAVFAIGVVAWWIASRGPDVPAAAHISPTAAAPISPASAAPTSTASTAAVAPLATIAEPVLPAAPAAQTDPPAANDPPPGNPTRAATPEPQNVPPPTARPATTSAPFPAQRPRRPSGRPYDPQGI